MSEVNYTNVPKFFAAAVTVKPKVESKDQKPVEKEKSNG